MAIAVEALPAAEAAEEGTAARGASTAVSVRPQRRQGGSDVVEAARRGYARVATPGATAQTITKLIWAVALGLIVLQIAAEATGQQWRFSLPAEGRKPTKEPYRPLYAGQASAAMPGFPVSVVGTGISTPGAGPGGTSLVAP